MTIWELAHTYQLSIITEPFFWTPYNEETTNNNPVSFRYPFFLEEIKNNYTNEYDESSQTASPHLQIIRGIPWFFFCERCWRRRRQTQIYKDYQLFTIIGDIRDEKQICFFQSGDCQGGFAFVQVQHKYLYIQYLLRINGKSSVFFKVKNREWEEIVPRKRTDSNATKKESILLSLYEELVIYRLFCFRKII